MKNADTTAAASKNRIMIKGSVDLFKGTHFDESLDRTDDFPRGRTFSLARKSSLSDVHEQREYIFYAC